VESSLAWESGIAGRESPNPDLGRVKKPVDSGQITRNESSYSLRQLKYKLLSFTQDAKSPEKGMRF